jgi:hypothetical protein
MCPSLGGCPTIERASPECREVEFCELRPNRVLGSSLVECSPKVGLMLTVAVMLVDGPLALLVGLAPG